MPSLSTSSSVFGRFTGRKQINEQADATATANAEENAVSPLETVTEGAGLGRRGTINANGNGHHRRKSSILSLTSSVSDLGHNVRRSTSLRSHRTQPSSGSGTFAHKPRFPSSGNTINSPLTTSPVEDDEKHIQPLPPTIAPPRSRGKFATATRTLSQKFKSTDTLPTLAGLNQAEPLPDRPPTAIDISKTPSMIAAPAVPKRAPPDKPALHAQASFSSAYSRDISSSHGLNGGLQHAPTNSSVPAGGYNPHTVFQQIHETSSKRMATIDYMRKVHEGNVYYFSTLHYAPAVLQTLPSMHPSKLGRRANNYLVLGNSLPALLDLNSGSPLEYCKALSALLHEFETYQNLSGVDGTGNSLSRGRMGQMFKSGMGLGIGKSRRASTATDAIAIPPMNGDMLGLPKSNTDPYNPLDSSPVNASGHEFLHLVTPHLPFEPDFSTTFATLCDTLIDTYARLLDLVSSPEVCSVAVGEAFGKADKAVRKILVANVLKEFEDNTRAGAKSEVAGLGRLVLGGLM